MNEESNILSKLKRKDGMTVPDAYFDDFAKRMEASLPERPEIEGKQARTRKFTMWQRVRPYVYMAAMFAGVWCMLKMFMLMTNTGHSGLSIDSNPTLANAVENEQFVEDYIIDDVTNWDLYNSMVEDSIAFYNLLDSTYNANPAADMAIPE